MSHAPGTVRKVMTFSAWLALVAVSVMPAVAAASITAHLEQAEIPVDRSTWLMVSLSGTSSSNPKMPAVPGLRFIPTGTSSQMQFVNGQMSSAVTYTFQVQASKPGNYTIPAITADINGKVESTRPIRLQVVKAAGPPSQSPQVFQPRVPGFQGTPRAAPQGSVARDAAFLKLETGKSRLYMGEMTPVAIKAYFRDGLGVNVMPPQLEGDAFVLHNLSDEPEKARVRVGDELYTVLTWKSAISAIKEGRYPIKAKLGATLQIPTRARRSPFGGSLFDNDFFGGRFFNDDFFNQFFGGVEEKQVSLATKARQIHVEPLPMKGRPADFSGAVGQFKLSVHATPTKVQVGDPITLKVTISGTGNFDRVTAPSLTDDAGWKIYEASDAFKRSDTAGYRGHKHFEQAIVPETSRIKAVPPVAFSYFDTHRKEYVTLRSKPIPIQLTGAATVPYVAQLPKSRSVQPSAEGGLVPIHLEIGRRATLEPLITQPWFIGLQGLPLGALLVGLLLYRRHSKTVASPEWVERKVNHKKVTGLLRDSESAVQRGDATAFIHASQRAIREQLAYVWHLRGDAITLAELNARLPNGYDGVRRVFEAADALAYSGQSFEAHDLKEWYGNVLSELDTLTNQQAREAR